MAFDTFKRWLGMIGIVATLFVMVFAIASCRHQHAGLDGFSICSFAMQQCEPINDATLQAHGLSPAEVGIVQQIKRLIVTREQAALDDLALAFADFAAAGRYAQRHRCLVPRPPRHSADHLFPARPALAFLRTGTRPGELRRAGQIHGAVELRAGAESRK